MAGTNYEMGLTCHKAVIESLERMMYTKFQESHDPLTEEAMLDIQVLQRSPNGHTLGNLMANDEVRGCIVDYMHFKKHLRGRSLGSTLNCGHPTPVMCG